MKHLIKRVLLASILVISLMLCSCNKKTVPSDNIASNDNDSSCIHLSDQSPYEQGKELIALITEMAENEAYVEMAINDDTVSGIIKTFAVGDRSNPLAVYAITWNKSIEDMITEEMVDPTEWNSMSDELRTFVVNRFRSSILTSINAQSGQYTVAATSLCTAGKSFINEDLKEDTIYLYTYENAKPAAVMFTVNEDSYIGASATFISNENLNCKSAEDIEAFFNSETDLVKVETVKE